MHWIDFEDYLDQKYGPIGTPRRDEFEEKAMAKVHRWEASQARKEARRQARREKIEKIISPIVNALNSKTEAVTV